MATNTPVTELDFDPLRSSLKQFLRSQTAFTDYDFDASNLSVLIDLLAYNTHYNAVLANMVNNEMFLDTALKRSSVVSLAKHLNYIPRSQRSAEAKVNVTLQNVPGSPNFVTLDRYTLFNTVIGGDTYSFYNNESYVATPSNGAYVFNNVKLFQGRKLEYYYTVGTAPGPTNKYVIPNQAVDTRTIQVAVQYGGSANFSETYTLNTNVAQLDGTTKVYFMEENTEGFYQIYFGDGILGRILTAGDIVKINYIVSDGDAANVSNNVPVTWTTNTIAAEVENDRSIVTVSKPSGGAVREGIESIRFNALNAYSANNRAVTNKDYAGIIQAQLPAARSVNVWGGEQNSPPSFGVVYISIAPKTGYYLTDDEKTRIITDILKPRSMVTMRHEFGDPEYTYLNFRITGTFNTGATNRTAQQISALLYAQVQTYITNNLETFNAIFYNSQLHKQLLEVDGSLLSVNIVQRLQKRIVPNVSSTVFSGNIYFPASLHPAEITSTKFVYTAGTAIYTAEIKDVPDQMPPDYAGTGTLKLYDISNGNVIIDKLGTVNYATGKCTINNLEITGYIGGLTNVRIMAQVQENSKDITPGYNEILELDDSSDNVTSGLENGIIVTSAGVNV
jgi:hypothetical protein